MKSLDRPRAAPYPEACRRTSLSRALLTLCATSSLLSLAACGAPVSATRSPAIRLVDLFESTQVERAASTPATPRPRTEWRFDSPTAKVSAPLKDAPAGKAAVRPQIAPTGKGASASTEPAASRGWEALSGIEGLAIRDGRLTGRTTTDMPLIHLERSVDPTDGDLLHAVEIRLQVSAAANLSISFSGAEKLDLKGVLEDARAFPWRMHSALSPGASRSCVLRSMRPNVASNMRHILIRVADAPGATFEIESIRLIFRKEYLAGIPSGVSWQGLSEIYHETIVSRAPESIRMTLTLPKAPWLDLAVGTIEETPVTFSVTLGPPSPSGASAKKALLETTVTRAHRWERTPIDLSAWAGQSVTLSLSLSGAPAGAIGFWGSPVIRSHGAPAVTTAATTSAAGDPPQGVILIWADTLRRDHLDVYGYGRETAPHLTKMASEGAIFRDCIGQATWTKVATPSLLTSLYPASHGVREFGDRIPSSATTLAEIYRDAGYATLSFSSILFTGQFTNLHQGFEEVHEDGSLPDKDSSKTAREYVDRLLPWLETHRDDPFFVFLHVSDPHDPYRPYPPYDTMWADASKREEHEKQAKEVKKFIADPLMKAFGMPSRGDLVKAGFDADAYVAADRDWYDGSIRGMDAEIGRLLERLRTLGLDEKTLVVFTGDHGEEFLEHGRMFHGQSTYGELSNVTLILRGPGRVPAGVSIGQPVETIDVMPTLLEISDLAPPAEIQGKSLRPLIAAAGPQPVESDLAHAEESAWGDRPAITEKAETHEVGGAPPPHDTESFAITLDGWKLVQNTKRAAGKQEFELFDAGKDPLNLTDVAAAHPEIVERLRKELDVWHAKAAAARLKPDSESTKAMSPEEMDRLKSLGYIQ